MPTPNRDPQHLAKLRDYYAKAKRIPSQQRIAELVGFSKAAARKLLERLAGEGFVERTPGAAAWVPGRRFFERPLSEGSVRAGMPVMVADLCAESFYLDEYLIREPSRTVLIHVRGDSMAEAHIDAGDIAVVERGKPAQVGDFVVAIVDGEFTLKELVIERGRFALKPHHPAYPLIVPEGELEVFGVVVGLIRRYGSRSR